MLACWIPPVVVAHPRVCPGYHAGRIPRNKGQRYPADPPRTEEIIAVMRCAGENLHGERARALIVLLWCSGLRIQEALSLTELDLDPRRGSVLVRRGKDGRRREIGMDVWGFEHIRPWLEARREMPVGPLFCVIDGRTRGRAWSAGAAPRSAPSARCPGRSATAIRAPTNCVTRTRSSSRARASRSTSSSASSATSPGRHIDLPPGHRPGQIIETIHARRPPMIPASAGLALRL
jgi:integrase